MNGRRAYGRGRGGGGGGGGSGGRGRGNTARRPPRGPKPDYDPNVPTIQQVTPGANVAIVLKADQSTGREVHGVVQDLLTRGNHPRGIKVRLQDGRVGRVQRMASGTTPTTAAAPFQVRSTVPPQTSNRIMRMERDARLDEGDFPEMPPPRNLAVFFPQSDGEEEAAHEAEPTDGASNGSFKTANVRCPFCDHFEGDEVAVSHHVEEHIA